MWLAEFDSSVFSNPRRVSVEAYIKAVFVFSIAPLTPTDHAQNVPFVIVPVLNGKWGATVPFTRIPLIGYTVASTEHVGGHIVSC